MCALKPNILSIVLCHVYRENRDERWQLELYFNLYYKFIVSIQVFKWNNGKEGIQITSEFPVGLNQVSKSMHMLKYGFMDFLQ